MISISIIIPTYGMPVFLKETLNSVCYQSFFNWELIIVDDNDPGTEARKKTESLVNEFLEKDTRIRYIKHNRNMNGAVARNTGISVAKGKYISFLDGDDLYKQDRLQKCFDLMEKSPLSVAGVYTGCEFRKSSEVYRIITDVKPGNFLKQTLATSFMFCTGSNIFVRKSVIDELKGFDENFLRHQDYEFLVRLFEKYSLDAIPEVLVVKNNENFNLPNLDKMVAIKKQYLNKYKYIIESMSVDDRNFVMHGNYMNIAENAQSQFNFSLANEYYALAARYGGLSAKELIRRLLYPIYSLFARNSISILSKKVISSLFFFEKKW